LFIKIGSSYKGADELTSQEVLTGQLLDYAKINKPHKGKSATQAATVSYIERPGEVAGEIRMVRGWYPIGQEVCTAAEII
jgi:hypothetical protein